MPVVSASQLPYPASGYE